MKRALETSPLRSDHVALSSFQSSGRLTATKREMARLAISPSFAFGKTSFSCDVIFNSALRPPKRKILNNEQ